MGCPQRNDKITIPAAKGFLHNCSMILMKQTALWFPGVLYACDRVSGWPQICAEGAVPIQQNSWNWKQGTRLRGMPVLTAFAL